jgi:AmpE protein
LLYICNEQALTKPAANLIIGWLDWVTARITLLLYLLVGNFQQGFNYYTQVFLSAPDKNAELLKRGGVLAAQTREETSISLPHAQNLVEHALVIFLVFLAFFTLVAWL